MVSGEAVVRGIEAAGFTHVVWVPDSHLGTWDATLSAWQTVCLIRPTREGEAVGLAAGLLLGGANPLVAVQCTGFFEAGDAVRNVAHDLKLPLRLLVGVRSWRAATHGKSADNCPTFAEPAGVEPRRELVRPVFGKRCGLCGCARSAGPGGSGERATLGGVSGAAVALRATALLRFPPTNPCGRRCDP
jgi:hypothetical protein